MSFVQWAGAWQRPQHMAVGFARLGWDVTYLSPGYIHLRGEETLSGVDLPPRLTVRTPAALPGSRRLPGVAEWNERRIGRAAVPPGGPDEPWDVLIFNDPRLVRAAGRTPARLRIFDAMDDLTGHSPDPRRAAARERESVALADLVWTGTSVMESRLRESHPPPARIRFVPCGADAERFGNPAPGEVARVRAELEALSGDRSPRGGPLALYFGYLNERLDPALITPLLDAGWRVVMIGPRAASMPPMPDRAGLILTGPRPYRDLPAWLALADLAIIPYRTDGPHASLYPVKALEYLAGGKPVLSTPLPDVKRFLGGFVLLADGPESWGRVAAQWNEHREEALRRAEAGRVHAGSRSWEAMVRDMAGDLPETVSGDLRGRGGGGDS